MANKTSQNNGEDAPKPSKKGTKRAKKPVKSPRKSSKNASVLEPKTKKARVSRGSSSDKTSKNPVFLWGRPPLIGSPGPQNGPRAFALRESGASGKNLSVATTIEPPAHLNDDERKNFLEIVAAVGELRTIGWGDLQAIEVAAIAADKMRRYNAELDKDGLTCFTDKGGLTAHPAAARFHQYQAEYMARLEDLGLSPRPKAKAKKDPNEKPTAPAPANNEPKQSPLSGLRIIS